MSNSTPPLEFPPGYLEEYSGRQVIVADVLILAIATILLCLRFYARSLTSVSKGWDDFLLIPAWIFLVALGAVIYICILRAGVGRHVQAVIAENPQKLAMYSKLLYVLDWFYLPTNALSRISVVLLYLRIFTSRIARLFCWAVIAFLIGNYVAFTISASLECFPFAYTWDKSIEGGHCFDQILWYKLSNFPNIVADIAILLLPVQTIWTIKASVARKAGIALVCLTASVGLIASCARAITFLIEGGEGGLIRIDPTWATPTLIWTIVESGMYFSAACLVGLRPLLSSVPSLIKKSKAMFSSTNSESQSRSRGVPLAPLKQQTGKRRGFTELDSISQFVSRDCDLESGVPGDDEGNGTNIHRNGARTGKIRVHTDIEVNSLKRDFAKSRTDLYSQGF